MKIQEKCQAIGRLATLQTAASDDLSVLIDKWLEKHFLKGLKLPLLNALHASQIFDSFAQLLKVAPEAQVITALQKVDPHNKDILTRSRAEMISRLGALASGDAAPSPKPVAVKATKAKKKTGGKTGIVTGSRY